MVGDAESDGDSGEGGAGLPRFITPQVEDWILAAVDCIETDTPGLRLTGENVARFGVLSEEIYRKMKLDHRRFRMSEGEVKSRMRDLYNQVKEEDDPVPEFGRRWKELVSELHQESLRTIRVGFPLNLADKFDSVPDDLEALGVRFEKISRTAWREQFLKAAREQSVWEQVERDALNPVDRLGWTFWVAELECRDLQFAMDRVEEALEVVLGTINFGRHYWQSKPWQMVNAIQPKRWSHLREPFIFLLVSEKGWEGLFYSRDITERKLVRLWNNKDRLKGIHSLLDEATGLDSGDAVDRRIIQGLRRYQAGITTSSDEDAFVAFWQALENVVLTGDEDNTATVVERGSGLLSFGYGDDLMEHRLERLRRKRNHLVHGKLRVSIDRDDLNLVKIMVDSKLMNLFNLRTKFSEVEISTLFDLGGEDDEGLNLYIEERQREIELAQEILDWRNPGDAEEEPDGSVTGGELVEE